MFESVFRACLSSCILLLDLFFTLCHPFNAYLSRIEPLQHVSLMPLATLGTFIPFLTSLTLIAHASWRLQNLFVIPCSPLRSVSHTLYRLEDPFVMLGSSFKTSMPYFIAAFTSVSHPL